MALVVPPPNDKKRVKVYELRNNDWFDRGTGFCIGHAANDESKILVESEELPDRILLETRISKDDGYQKQQDTLIVWTESNGTDMALSFQEADGCAAIWDFVSQVQQHLLALGGPDDALSDDAMETFQAPVMLPQPELGNLAEIDQMMRVASSTPAGRDSVAKFVLAEDYFRKLVPLVDIAEELQALPELHRLSNIMKMLILLNETQIIEHVVSDDIVLGVVGALEYDQDFPHHKANHRQYLKDRSRFKEVVPINEPVVEKKIHSTWRLQYLKDVVLARILDDPTFSVLNSLIFFNQVDIVKHLTSNPSFLKELFHIIDAPDTEVRRKKDAVCFLQQCCAIAKNLQAPLRQQFYQNFIHNGLLRVVTLALSHKEASIRIAGTDILVAMIDHDPTLMRNKIFEAINEHKTPLTDTLIDLLLVESDLGVKAQVSDAIKVLLDPQTTNPPTHNNVARGDSAEFSRAKPNGASNTQTDIFIQKFYDDAAKKLFQPLKNLERRESLQNFTYHEVSLFVHLIEILMFFIRQHLFRSKYFILTEGLAARISQLLSCPQKHLKLTALKFFRTCIGLQEEFYNKQIMQNHLFEPILNILYDTMPRDNLLNSACLELFEFIKRENIKPIINHIAENYREKLKDIKYVDTFENLLLRYDQMQGYSAEMDGQLFSQEDSLAPMRSKLNGNQRWQGMKDMDPTEEEYFNTSDDEDELASARPRTSSLLTNGSSPFKPLVDYPDDEEEATEMKARSPTRRTALPLQEDTQSDTSEAASPRPHTLIPQSPPERVSEKRRREEDEEDELGKLSLTKRRSSSVGSANSNPGSFLRRKKSFTNSKDPSTGKGKIAISFKSAIEADHTRNEGR